MVIKTSIRITTILYMFLFLGDAYLNAQEMQYYIIPVYSCGDSCLCVKTFHLDTDDNILGPTPDKMIVGKDKSLEDIYRTVCDSLLKNKYVTAKIKIIMDIVVDTSGIVRCAVLKHGNKDIAHQVLKMYSKYKFYPASIRNKFIIYHFPFIWINDKNTNR